LGFPEARIALSQCTVYLAASPKSNRSYVAIDRALADVKSKGALEIPLSLRNAPTGLLKQAGYGKDYAYAHDDLAGARKLAYLPAELRGRKYYQPIPVGAETQLIENLKHLRPTED
ncbi:MAG: replication-associated recombination protein A, partial [Proteobacteria bacterium]|nr:replication-associated recombination protein A [Pseudomonadota bacterium]